ncbi:carboxymuconolactone decarboxylase family protein [Nocardioides dubius]|uniref:Carboxymuconolactone decarboxylase family protein n=1 Tax=Nocardioides dubius TaxID=317019 RepID=A0ABN1TLG4_9ACTN
MSRPRVTPGARRDTGVLISLFAKVAGRVSRTEPPAVFLTLGRSRRMFWGWLHFAGTLMPGGRLGRRRTELVILRVAHRRDNTYEWTQHAGLARRAGLSAAEVEQVRDDAASWPAPEALLLEVTDELLAHDDLSDATWARLRATFDEPTCIELLMLIGHYRMLATTLSTLRVQPDRPSM